MKKDNTSFSEVKTCREL